MSDADRMYTFRWTNLCNNITKGRYTVAVMRFSLNECLRVLLTVELGQVRIVQISGYRETFLALNRPKGRKTVLTVKK